MKQYNHRLFIRIALLILLAGAVGASIVLQKYWISLVGVFLLIGTALNTYRFLQRTVKDMQRLISAIQFSEFNISFQYFGAKGLAPELIPHMEEALGTFNQRLRALKSEQDFYDTLLSRIDFGIMVVNKKGKIVWINKSASDLFERPQPRVLEDLKKISPQLPLLFAELRSQESKVIKLIQNNQVQQIAVSAIQLTIEGEQLKLISLKNVQSVLEESESDAWKKLIRVLTHEIMNSITPIISLAETFSEENEENREMMTHAMQTIHRRSKGLIDFVHNYQKLSRIPNPVFSIFPVAELVRDIRALLRAEGMDFTYTINPENITIKADRAQMEQVLINLVKNAYEAATNKEQIKVDIDIFLNHYQRPVIRVNDNGEGILPEVLDKVFVPFFTTKSSGSGIGLSICRQIINMHGGTITVQSEPSAGSSFRIQL